MCHFADFFDFQKGWYYLNTIARKRSKKKTNMGFLHFCLRTYITLLVLKHHCLALVWSWEKNCVKMCHFFADFLDFENGCCYLNTIARKRRKTHGFLAFLLKIVHYVIGLNTSLFYIRMVKGKNMLKRAFLADFLDFENGRCYLNTIARKRGKKTHGFSCIFT